MSELVDRIVANIARLEVKLWACQARLEADTDPEALHDLRTTVRRLRSLLRPLRGLPGVVQLEMSASQVGVLTTPLRDLEVLAAHLHKAGYTGLAQRRLQQLAGSYARVADSEQLAQLLMILDVFPRFCARPSVKGCCAVCASASKRCWKNSGKPWKKPLMTRAMTAIAYGC